MTTTTKPCTIGPRHRWSWVKNVTAGQIGGRTASFTLRGVYRCACGSKKVGQPNQDGSDLSGLFGGDALLADATKKEEA